MNTTLPVSKHSKLFLRLLEPLRPSYVLKRQLCTELEPQPPPAPSQDDESKITQAVQLLLETPKEEWSSSQILQSLPFSSPSPSSRFLLQITRQLPSFCKALEFFKYLRHNYPSQDTEFLSYPFQALLEQAGRGADPATRLSELYQASKEWDIHLTVNSAVFVIRYFGRVEMVDKSVLVFEELDPSLKNTHIRNVLIDVLFRDGRVDYALNVLEEMLQPSSEVPPNDVTGDIVFYALMRTDGKGRSFSEEEIIKLVLEFGEHAIFPKSRWLRQLVTKLCGSGNINKACDVMLELLRLRAPLDVSLLNALLTALGRSGDVRRMNALLVEMKDRDIQPNIITFGIIINQLCKLRRIDEAMEVFNKMGEGTGNDGFSVEADVITYNTLIDGLCKVGRQEEGLRLMKQMRSIKGFAPTKVTYNCLIDGFCKAGEIERGKQLFDEMIEEGISPNVISLNTLVDGMCRHGRTSNALEFFNNMQGKGLRGNVVTYTTLITAFCSVNNLDKAVDLFDQMFKSGCSADAIVYYSLISGLCQAGRMNDASNVLAKLKEDGFRPDLVCYNVLISGFCKRNKIDKAYEILKEMEEAGVKFDIVTYNTLIAYLSKIGDFATVRRVMRQMIKEGIIPTVATYGALLHAYCLNGKTNEAMKLFKDMSSVSHIPPNTVIYNILIESLCKNDDVKSALSLMDDMKARGLKPNTTTYNALFKGVKEMNQLEDAFRLMDSMVEHGCNPDYITMEILTEWLSVVGESEKLKRFVQGYKVSTLTA